MRKSNENPEMLNDVQEPSVEKNDEKFSSTITLRVTPDDRSKFERIYASSGKKVKGEVFHTLLASAEVDQIRTSKPGIATLVDNFKSHCASLNEVFTGAVNILTDEKNVVEEKYRVRVEDLDRTVTELRSKVEQYKKQAEENEEIINSLRKENKLLNQNCEYLEDMRKRVNDAEKMKNTAVLELKTVKENVDAANKRADTFERRTEKAETEVKDLKNRLIMVQDELKQCKEREERITGEILKTFERMGVPVQLSEMPSNAGGSSAPSKK